VLDGLSAQQGKAETLLVHLKGALEAGSEAASSVERITASVQGLMARTRAPPYPGAPPSKPFDIDDYTRALAQLEKTTANLQQLVDSLDDSAPRAEALVDRATQQASTRGKGLADYVFWRAIAAIGVLLVGSLGAALAYRWAAARILSSS
jgi:hypothetical protein